MCFKCCKKIDCIFNEELKLRQIVFKYHKNKIEEALQQFTTGKYDNEEDLDDVIKTDKAIECMGDRIKGIFDVN